MSGGDARLEAASREALARRERLKAGAAAIRQRLTPARLVQDGKAHVTAQAKAVVADGQARVRAHPVATAAIVAGLAAWVLRKPLLRLAPPLVQRGYDWMAGKLPFSEIVAEEGATEQVEDDVEGEVERQNAPETDPELPAD